MIKSRLLHLTPALQLNKAPSPTADIRQEDSDDKAIEMDLSGRALQNSPTSQDKPHLAVLVRMSRRRKPKSQMVCSAASTAGRGLGDGLTLVQGNGKDIQHLVGSLPGGRRGVKRI